MTDLDELIARLEAASEGSWELDARIHAALHPEQAVLLDAGDVQARRAPRWGKLSDFPLDGWKDYEAVAREMNAPAYSSSLDAALTLVPDGMDWKVRTIARPPYQGKYPAEAVVCNVKYSGHAATPALALCIASLRARSRKP